MATRSRGPRSRGQRALITAAGVVLGIFAVVALIAFFLSRDTATFESDAVKGPGQQFPDQGHEVVAPAKAAGFHFASKPPTSGPYARRVVQSYAGSLTNNEALTALAPGNVVIWVSDPTEVAVASELARSYDQPTLKGSGFRALAASGQAVLVSPGASLRAPVVVSAWRHLLPADDAGSPQVRDFIDFWLGRGAH